MARRSAESETPAVKLERRSGVALHHQLYLALRHQILEGKIASGERLPSSRAMAKTLGVSRNTVVDAYERLAAACLLTARVGSGTLVAERIPARRLVSLGSTYASHAAAGRARGTGPSAGIAAILRRACFPYHRVIFQDADANHLYLYESMFNAVGQAQH